jgi:hypothetical protein
MQNDLLRLPIRFEKNGFIYWQICRTDKAAIYEQKMKDGRRVFYEVWQIRRRPAYVLNGQQYPESERGPGTQDWGRYGWTLYTLPDAKKRYDLVNGWSAVMESLSDKDTDPGNATVYAGIVPDQVPTVNLGA